MFSLRDLVFVHCSLDLNVLRARRIIGFFYLNYPQINQVGNSDHVVGTNRKHEMIINLYNDN